MGATTRARKRIWRRMHDRAEIARRSLSLDADAKNRMLPKLACPVARGLNTADSFCCIARN